MQHRLPHPARPTGVLAAASALVFSVTGASAANYLINGSFEPGTGIPADTGTQFPTTVGTGWNTQNFTELEINGSAVGPGAFTNTDPSDTIPDDNGTQFAELNSQGPETLWQDVVIPTADPVQFSFAHAGRNGIDSIKATLTYAGPDANFGTGDDVVTTGTAVSNDPFSDTDPIWKSTTLTSIIPVAGGKYRVTLESLTVDHPEWSEPVGSEGNYIDSVYLGPVIVPVPEPSAMGLVGLAGAAGLMRRRRK